MNLLQLKKDLFSTLFYYFIWWLFFFSEHWHDLKNKALIYLFKLKNKVPPNTQFLLDFYFELTYILFKNSGVLIKDWVWDCSMNEPLMFISGLWIISGQKVDARRKL